MKYAVLVLVAVMACGPSAAEIRSARDATYAMDPPHLLQIAMHAANDLYGIGAVDVQNHRFVTKSFLTWDTGKHRGWEDVCARGGWQVEVHATGDRSFVSIRPLAQASITPCGRPFAPTWVDADPDAIGLRPALEQGADKLALAIHDRASR